MAFPLIRLYTGDDNESHFEKGTLELPKVEGTAHRSRSWQATLVSFEESPAGSRLDWHRAPVRQYVVTPEWNPGVRDPARREIRTRSRHHPVGRGHHRRWSQVASHRRSTLAAGLC